VELSGEVSHRAPAGGLTPREQEILRLVADGLTNRQIGDQLFITEKTASHHVSNILGKLGVSGRAEAAAASVRLGITPPAE
jgi:DNA-binding NarL/FixJ family response regulator